MEPVQEHGEELLQTRALDNVLEWGVRGRGTDAWVHIAEQPPDTNVVEHKTQVSPYGIKNDLKHHKSDSCINPKRFYEVEQQARPSTGAGLAKNGPKSQFQSFPDPNPGLTGSNPVSTPNPDPNPVLIRFLLLIRF